MDAGTLYCLEGAKEIHRYSLFSRNALDSSCLLPLSLVRLAREMRFKSKAWDNNERGFYELLRSGGKLEDKESLKGNHSRSGNPVVEEKAREKGEEFVGGEVLRGLRPICLNMKGNWEIVNR